MKRVLRAVFLLCLALSVLLSGCGIVGQWLGGGLVSYDRMEYVRPDMLKFSSVLNKSCDTALEHEDIDVVEDAIWEFYAVYDDFYTNYYLAMLEYSRDLTDLYWEQEYNYCITHSTQVDAGLDRLYRSLAQSPVRQILEGEDYFGSGYFDSFEGESIYDEYLTDLLTQEAGLCAQYQTISGEAAAVEYYSEAYFTEYGTQMAELFLELVELRQQIADYVGYDDYVSFAYDFYHIRDYTPQQAISYMAEIRAELVPLYQQVAQSGIWEQEVSTSSEEDTFAFLQSTAKNMGGTVADAFSAMKRAGVYDISYGPNKYNASFELYLPNYYTPYVFLCPTGTVYDQLTFAHEFGHFCCDYVTIGGSMQSVDVSEVFSQAMEYFGILYADNAEDLKQLKMADCLGVYVQQAAYASFEHQVYALEGEDLTVENIQTLYEQICISYGVDSPYWDSRDYVCIPHFYNNPLYIISYVISNDAAFQLYQMEEANPGSGVACFEENLSSSQVYFLAFTEEMGLESPFATGRLLRVRQTLEEVLQS